MTRIIASGNTVAPSLDELLVSDDPAWLWDGERARIVWANHAGTTWFGTETLFDLLEIVFDEDEPDVANIKKLTTRLPRGQSASVQVKFSAAATNQLLACTCYVHTLADGRSGLLVCADPVSQTANALPAAVQAMALGAFPLPVCVVSGSGDMVFSNDALQTIVPANCDADFIHDLAGDLIEKSYTAGLTSGLKEVETKHGRRDVKIMARPLEKADRLADSSFLLVLEDVTERRSLERSLLEAADAGLAEDDDESQKNVAIELEISPEPSTQPVEPSTAQEEPSAQPVEPSATQTEPSLDNEVVRALTALRLEIEKQTNQAVAQNNNIDNSASTKPVTAKSPVPEKPEASAVRSVAVSDKTRVDISVPDIVSSTLNSLPQPLVLVDQEGNLLFANTITIELMGVNTWPEIGERTTLGDAIAALDGEDGSISLFTAKDEPISLDVIMSTFPWKDGPVYQATLSPGSDGEEADNRRAVDSGHSAQKKTLKK